MNELPKRKTNRLENITYTENGSYFITVCVKDMKCILAQIVGGGDLDAPKVKLSAYGKIVEENINRMNDIYENIQCEKYVIMPNHLHLLISINDSTPDIDGTPRSSSPTEEESQLRGTPRSSSPTVSEYIGTMKRFVNKEIGQNIWQRSFYDHVIRDVDDYEIKWRYIDENPAKWLLCKDEYHPEHK